MRKILMAIMGIAVILAGCGKEKEESLKVKQEQLDDIYAEDQDEDYSSTDNNLTDHLELVSWNSEDRSKLTYAVGEIKNNSDQDIDSIGDMVFLSEDDSVITVKKVMVKVGAGESIYFDELIGLTEDLTERPNKMLLQGFE
ncbi:hypothetical protein [Siminovitchia sp. 179-K 8D1 HS]|uniref:hypothetical protein n=1 Tax=Siminovitchia sp. 179-K 8D1 HS TaxID=3142385 RepID=UPI0039A2D23A